LVLRLVSFTSIPRNLVQRNSNDWYLHDDGME
jgi:hypothetical protein